MLGTMRAEEVSARGCARAGREHAESGAGIEPALGQERAKSGAGIEPASCEKAQVRLLLQGELAGEFKWKNVGH